MNFNDPETWKNYDKDQQVSRRAEILKSLIPPDVKTILDAYMNYRLPIKCQSCLPQEGGLSLHSEVTDLIQAYETQSKLMNVLNWMIIKYCPYWLISLIVRKRIH